MGRFALRKQEKIKAAFEPNGDKILNRIKESLTRHNPGDVLNLLLDGNDIGLMCRVESCNDRYYKFCKVIKEGENDINRGTTGNIER